MKCELLSKKRRPRNVIYEQRIGYCYVWSIKLEQWKMGKCRFKVHTSHFILHISIFPVYGSHFKVQTSPFRVETSQLRFHISFFTVPFHTLQFHFILQCSKYSVKYAALNLTYEMRTTKCAV